MLTIQPPTFAALDRDHLGRTVIKAIGRLPVPARGHHQAERFQACYDSLESSGPRELLHRLWALYEASDPESVAVLEDIATQPTVGEMEKARHLCMLAP